MKILILIISSVGEPYNRLEEAIRRTWGKNKNKDVEIFYNYGNGTSPSKIYGDKIICESEETLHNIGKKTIKSFELLYENYEFDYIFRTNLSSYVNIDNMLRYLIDKQRKNFYGGMCTLNFSGEHLQKFGEGTFASGSGYFLSKDVVSLIIDNKELWDHSVIDDVAIAGLLKKLGILPKLCPRIDIDHISNDIFYYNGAPVSNDDINRCYHFRCKTSGDRSGDIEIFKKLNSKFNG